MEIFTVNSSAFSEFSEYGTTHFITTASTQHEQNPSMPLQPNIPQAIAFGASTALIIVANTLTLLVLHQKPSCFEEVPRLIFQALAVTDLLTGMFCCFFSFLFSCAPHFQNSVTCTIRTMACTGCLNQSALTMAFATMDRYIAITKPLRYASIMTAKRAWQVIIVLVSVSVGNAMFTNVGADFASRKRTCVSDFTAVGIGISFRPSLVVILLIFYGSLVVSTFANYNVVRIALRHSRVVRDGIPIQHRRSIHVLPSEHPTNSNGHGNAPQPNRANRIKMRSLWTVVMATVSFYVLVMPWNIMASMHFAHHVQIPHLLRIAAAFLLINNSWWNTVVYSLLNTTFRRTVVRTVLRVCRRHAEEGALESTIVMTVSDRQNEIENL